MTKVKGTLIMKDKKKNTNSFKFITMGFIVTFLIIGMLSSCNNKKKQRLESCIENVRNIGITVINYSTDNKGHYPQNLEILEELGYIKKLPSCPETGKPYLYQVDGWDSNDFTVTCPNHEKHPKGHERELFYILTEVEYPDL